MHSDFFLGGSEGLTANLDMVDGLWNHSEGLVERSLGKVSYFWV